MLLKWKRLMMEFVQVCNRSGLQAWWIFIEQVDSSDLNRGFQPACDAEFRLSLRRGRHP